MVLSLSRSTRCALKKTTYLKLGNREISLFVFGPKTAESRISDDIHRWHFRVLMGGKHNINISKTLRDNLLQSSSPQLNEYKRDPTTQLACLTPLNCARCRNKPDIHDIRLQCCQIVTGVAGMTIRLHYNHSWRVGSSLLHIVAI